MLTNMLDGDAAGHVVRTFVERLSMSGTSRTSTIWRTLLERGYLPEVLPPNFQTAQFMEFVVNWVGEKFIGHPSGDFDDARR